MPLETVVDSLEDVIAESSSESYTNGLGEIVQDTEVDQAGSESAAIDQDVQVEQIEEEMPVISFLAAGDYVVDISDYSNLYTVSISGSEYTLFLPEDASVEVFDDYLVNVGSSAVSGLLLTDQSADLATYHDLVLTLQPFFGSSANTNAYRYGSWSYVTAYEPGSYSLDGTQTYVQVQVIVDPKPFYDFSASELVICGLLFCSVCLGIVRSVFGK